MAAEHPPEEQEEKGFVVSDKTTVYAFRLENNGHRTARTGRARIPAIT